MVIVLNEDAFRGESRKKYIDDFLTKLTEALNVRGVQTTIKKENSMDLDPISLKSLKQYQVVMFINAPYIAINQYGHITRATLKITGVDTKNDQKAFDGAIYIDSKPVAVSMLIRSFKDAGLL